MKGKKIMVTGGAGFLGSHVIEQFKEKGCAELIIPRSHQYDLRDSSVAFSLVKDTKPDIIVHLAASVGGIGANSKKPGTLFYDNAAMGIHLMEAARLNQVEKVVICGTICAYPKFAAIPFKEEALWEGYPEETNAPYGLAKKMLLVQSQAYRQQYGFNSIFLLPVNLYGPRDNFDLESSHVIPALIRKCVEAKEKGQERIQAWGTGKVTREFIYVEDAAEAIVLATEKYNGAEPVNVGTGEEISIHALASMIANQTGFTGEIVWDSNKPDGQPRRCLDVAKSKALFGFEASTTLKEGLQKTIDWYVKNRMTE
ncbi:GDP-L-fucose synthase family protein [Neobacillus sp. 19]|uniref:GDP-L-fucose synthase family protein n=1 Tax=Neobacillus sp. 19 TaxID=3394458 RepID=UPI003BF68855